MLKKIIAIKSILGIIIVILFLANCTSEISESNTTSDINIAIKNSSKIINDSLIINKITPNKKPSVRIGTAPIRLATQEKLDLMHEKLMNQMETGFIKKNVVAYAKEAELYMSIYGDSLAAEHLFNAADLYRGIGDFTKALDTWYIVYKSYDRDGHPKAPHAMFQCGFTYDSILNNKYLAKTLYKMFLKRYPDHALAKDATLLLANMDKSPEDLIKEFQKKNKQ